MADENEEIEVELELGELAPEVKEEAETPDPEIIADLKRQIADERAKRIEAQRQAHEANQRAHVATVDKDDTDLQLVSNAIDTLTGNQAVLRNDYQIAMERQDFAAGAEIQQSMADNAARLLQLENGREAMTKKPKPEAPVAPAPNIDPVDDLAGRLTAKSAAWVRQNPQVATDARLTRKMVRAHQDAIDDGLVAESPEYFAYVENRLGIGASDASKAAEAGGGAQLVQRRDSAPSPAPVERGNGGGKNVVRLTAEQREIAQLNGMTDKEYAAQLVRMRNENGRSH